MHTNQYVADGGRSTFTVQNNRDFAVTAIGVFSGEAARDMGIKRFDTAAAKRLLATKGMNVLRTPVVIKPGQKATLDVQFPGCREDWDAFVAMTRPGYEDTPVLKYVQTEFYTDHSAPVGSHHVRGAVVLSPPKAGAPVPPRSPAKPKQKVPVRSSNVAESAVRRIVRMLLEARDISALMGKLEKAPPSPVLRSPEELAARPDLGFKTSIRAGTGRVKVTPEYTEYEYGVQGDRPGQVKTLRGRVDHQMTWDKNAYAHNRINNIFHNSGVMSHETVKADRDGNAMVGKQSLEDSAAAAAARERELDRQWEAQQEAEMAERDRQIVAGEIKVSRKSRARARARYERREAIARGETPASLSDDGPDEV